jgi:hypothetical protein
MPDESSESRLKSINLKTALILVIGVSLILVSFSYYLYSKSEYYKYDLARPDVKTKVEANDSQGSVDVYLKVDGKSVTETKEFIKAQQKILDSLDTFNKPPLSNESLTLN